MGEGRTKPAERRTTLRIYAVVAVLLSAGTILLIVLLSTNSSGSSGTSLPLLALDAVRDCTLDSECFDLPVGNDKLQWTFRGLINAGNETAVEAINFDDETVVDVDAVSVTAWFNVTNVTPEVRHTSTDCSALVAAGEEAAGVSASSCRVFPLRRLQEELGGGQDVQLLPNCSVHMDQPSGGLRIAAAAGSSPLCTFAVLYGQVQGAPFLNKALQAFLWEKQAPADPPGDGNVSVATFYDLPARYRWAALLFDDAASPLYPEEEPDWSACSRSPPLEVSAFPACFLLDLEEDKDWSGESWGSCDGLRWNASSRTLTGGEACLAPQLHVFATGATNRYSGSCVESTCSCFVPNSLLYPHWYYESFEFGNPQGTIRKPDCSLDLCWEVGERCDYLTTYCRAYKEELDAYCECLDGYSYVEESEEDGVQRCFDKNECQDEDLHFCPFNAHFEKDSSWHFVGTQFTEFSFQVNLDGSGNYSGVLRPIGQPLPASAKTLAIALWAGEETSSSRNTEEARGWPSGDQENYRVQFGTTRCSHSAQPLEREIRELEGACFYEPLTFLNGSERVRANTTLEINTDGGGPRPRSNIGECEIYLEANTRQLWLVDKSLYESCAVAVYFSELESQGRTCTNEEGSFACSAGCPEGSEEGAGGECVCPDYVEQPLLQQGLYRGKGYSLNSTDFIWDSTSDTYFLLGDPADVDRWTFDCSEPGALEPDAAVESGFWQACADACFDAQPECEAFNVAVIEIGEGRCRRVCTGYDANRFLDSPPEFLQSYAAYSVWPEACATVPPVQPLKPLFCPSFEPESGEELPPTFLLDLSDIEVEAGAVPKLEDWLLQGKTDRIWRFQDPMLDESTLFDLLSTLSFSTVQLVGQSNYPDYFPFPLSSSLSVLLSLFFGGNVTESEYWPALELSSASNVSKFYLSADDNEEYWTALFGDSAFFAPVEYTNTKIDPQYWSTEIPQKGMYTFRYEGELNNTYPGSESLEDCGFNLLVVESKPADQQCSEGFREESSAEAGKTWCNCYDTCGNWVEGTACEGWSTDSALHLFDLVNCASASDPDGVKNISFALPDRQVGSSWSAVSTVYLDAVAKIVFNGVCLPLQPTESMFDTLKDRYTLEAGIALSAPASGIVSVLPTFDISNEAFHVFTNYSESPLFSTFAGWLGASLPTFSEAARGDWVLEITVHALDGSTGESRTDSCEIAFKLECPQETTKVQVASGDGTFTYCVCEDVGVETENSPFYYEQQLFAFNPVFNELVPDLGYNVSLESYTAQDFGCSDGVAPEEGLRRCLQSCAAEPDCVGINYGYLTPTTQANCTPTCGLALSSENATLSADLGSWQEAQAYSIVRDAASVCQEVPLI